MSTLPKSFLTPEQYLEIERKAEFRSEYLNGQMFAMAGGTTKHDDIVAQLSFLLAQHLRGTDCRWQTSNMRILAEPGGLYTYPDLSVVCGERRFADSQMDTLTNPNLLIEVLSPSTQRYDRGDKAKLYREIASLRELLLISQDRYEVELYRRQAGDSWLLLKISGIEFSVELTSIGYTLQLADLYERVIEP